MRPTLSARLLATIRHYGMIVPGDRVAVAVSGGGDSVALLLLLMELRGVLGLTVSVAHFNHRLRLEEADKDEEFVRKLASELGLTCSVHAEDVAALSRLSGANLEAEARERRYAFFHQLVSQGHATRIATAHTADDQAETVLMRLGSGSGLRGLRAIHPVLGPVVRPLIELRRAELRDYLAGHAQPWREDLTNLDTSRLRVRIRHRLVPAWESAFGPAGILNLVRLADMAGDDELLIGELVEKTFGSLSRSSSGRLEMDVQNLLNPVAELKSAGARRAFAARLVRRAAEEVSGGKLRLTASHISSVLELARQRTSGKRLHLPGGLVVERVLSRLIFESRYENTPANPHQSPFAYPADPWRTGETIVQIAETGKRLRLKLIDWPAEGSETYAEGDGALDAGRLKPPLLIRSRLPGDSYRPRGRKHAEKLKRLLLEQRIGGKDRAVWPVLTSAGQVVWSSGLPVAADFAAGSSTQRALIIREERQEMDEARLPS